jgi:hypothetical protein
MLLLVVLGSYFDNKIKVASKLLLSKQLSRTTNNNNTIIIPNLK